MSEELDRRLRGSAPVVRCEAYTATLDGLLNQVTAGGRPRSRWTRPSLGVALAALVFVPSAAVAAGVHFAAATGEYGPEELTESNTSEYIDLCAPDIREYLLSKTPTGLPLPAGVSWSALADRTVTNVQGDDCAPAGLGTMTQERGIALFLLSPAACAWATAFVEADSTGSAERSAEAAAGLVRIEDALLATGHDPAARDRRDRAAREDAAAIRQQHALCQPAGTVHDAEDEPA